MERVILSFHLVKGYLSNFSILYDLEHHLNSIFPNSNINNKFLFIKIYLIE